MPPCKSRSSGPGCRGRGVRLRKGWRSLAVVHKADGCRDILGMLRLAEGCRWFRRGIFGAQTESPIQDGRNMYIVVNFESRTYEKISH